MARTTSDITSGLVLVGASAVLYFYLIPNFVEGSESGAMSPQFFPRLGTILIGIGGAALILITVVTRASEETASEPKDQTGSSGKTIVALLIAAAMAGFILLFQWVGYFYAAPPLIAVLMFLFGARNPLIIVLTAAGATGALYAVFSLGLNLPLV